MLFELMVLASLSKASHYCTPLAFRDSELIFGRQAVVIVPISCNFPALIRERNSSSKSVAPPQVLVPGSVTKFWLFTHLLEYSNDGKTWNRLKVKG